MDRRPAWKFAERVQIKVAYSKYGVATWLSQSRLADCCAMSSFRPPYASVAARAYAATAGALYVPPLTSRAQTMRAILLARAVVTSMRGLRASIRASHEPAAAPRRLAQRTTALAPRISNRRMVRSPIFEMAPSLRLPPVDLCSGVSPSQAAK